ncbi:hypothetical protein [Streptomyces sp. NPDC086777]|uniref:hypothetical protein n=1 Tax=Streptomyces sp. NPDC086777 TaxID=3154866 RepID=UPI00344CA10F
MTARVLGPNWEATAGPYAVTGHLKNPTRSTGTYTLSVAEGTLQLHHGRFTDPCARIDGDGLPTLDDAVAEAIPELVFQPSSVWVPLRCGFVSLGFFRCVHEVRTAACWKTLDHHGETSCAVAAVPPVWLRRGPETQSVPASGGLHVRVLSQATSVEAVAGGGRGGSGGEQGDRVRTRRRSNPGVPSAGRESPSSGAALDC